MSEDVNTPERAVLVEFVERFLDDERRGSPLPVARYQAIFPGFEPAIAREYARLEEARRASGSQPALETGRDPRESREASADGERTGDFGSYRLIELLGRGGQGTVHLAEDLRLRRKVALKVLTGISLVSADARERFRREAEVASRLSHPGICTVFDHGIEGGVPYIAMRYVAGVSLHALNAAARERPTGTAAESTGRGTTRGEVMATVALVEKVARALHAAHEGGVVHRDVKPGNILVGDDGEPVVVDFGLARDLESDAATLTATGDVFGTPAYMAPEQISGAGGRTDRRMDVWALGVTLFEALTFVRPFEGPTRERLCHAILERDPPRARTLNPAIPRDLEVVVATALEKDPDRRYQTALDLAEDLRRVRALEPVRARPAGAAFRLLRWAQRNRALAAAVASVFVALAAGLGVALHLLGEARRERDGKAAAVADFERLADVKRLQDLVTEEEKLHPAVPKHVPALKAWLARAARLVEALPRHREALRNLEVSVAPDDEANIFLRSTLARLITDLEAFSGSDPVHGVRNRMQRRLAFAESVERRTLVEQSDRWNDAVRSIADVAECPDYKGLEIRPQLGLIPIGRDPRTRLWEFLHLRSAADGGPLPRRGEDGRLQIAEDTGLVLVLIPGGQFRMGAVPPSGKRPAGTPNVDPDAVPRYGPDQRVELSPFFLSKYEMTQAQWLRVTGGNPSYYFAGRLVEGRTHGLLEPVEMVSWKECAFVMGALDLVLPTEAQWERAARGGTTTPWYTGAEKETLRGAANLADLALQKLTASKETESWLDDGFGAHAPVGSFAANPFGLHDILGNVYEWCEDWEGPYRDNPPLDEDGLREPGTRLNKICRGGSYWTPASSLTSASRNWDLPDARLGHRGVRPARRLSR